MFTEAFLHDFRLNYGCKLEDAVCDFLSFFVVLLNQTGFDQRFGNFFVGLFNILLNIGPILVKF